MNDAYAANPYRRWEHCAPSEVSDAGWTAAVDVREPGPLSSDLLCSDRPATATVGSGADAPARANRRPDGRSPGALPPSPALAGLGSRLWSLRLAFWGVALLLGTFDACYRPFATGPFGAWPDAVSYLDIASAYARGDWGHALNAYWSPLYSWLLALAFRVLHPGPQSEFPVVHLVNLVIYIAALGSFDYLWRGWMGDHLGRAAEPGHAGWISLPPWALLAIGYSLFIWSSIRLIGVEMVTPDLLVAGLVYLAAGLTLRFRRGEPRPPTAVMASPFMLGLVLGLGFLAKTVMLPLAPVFLLVAFLPVRNARRAGLGLLVAAIAFLAVSGPFIGALSRRAGHLTVGDTGRLNYAWYVNHVPQFNWEGRTPGQGTLRHPMRRIHPSPPVYEFTGPPGQTYPLWTDPSYWNEGLMARFSARQQGRAFWESLRRYGYQFLWLEQSGLVAGLLLLLICSVPARRGRWLPAVRWDLLVISLAPALLYAFVVVNARYLAASMVLFWLALLPAVRLRATRTNRAIIVAASSLVLLTLGFGLVRAGVRNMTHRRVGEADWRTAAGLGALGIRPGDRVGCIGLSWEMGWARLARISVIADLPTERVAGYWNGSPEVKAAVLRAFAKVGARAVVTERPPGFSAPKGWQRLGQTDRYVYLLPSAAWMS